MLFEASAIMNPVTVIVYWGFIHNQIIHESYGKPWEYFHMHVVHIFPALATLANFVVTDVYLKSSHWIPFVPLGIIYSYINYKQTMLLGEPVYPILTW